MSHSSDALPKCTEFSATVNWGEYAFFYVLANGNLGLDVARRTATATGKIAAIAVPFDRLSAYSRVLPSDARRNRCLRGGTKGHGFCEVNRRIGPIGG